MDDRWETEVIEYGAINITGFRIVDTSRRYVKDFLDGWKRLDPTTSLGAGKESISVCIIKLFYIHNNYYGILMFCVCYVYIMYTGIQQYIIYCILYLLLMNRYVL